MKIFKPPHDIRKENLDKSIFLAGSIEMGKADDWQMEIEKLLADYDGVILNPRRDDWDESWSQDIENDQFRQQVEWELYALESASIIIMYFQPDTNSRITLLEFGLYARSGKLVVCCPDGFERKGNIDVTSKYYNVPMVDSLDDLKNYLKLIIS